jgi:hypothetical protein
MPSCRGLVADDRPRPGQGGVFGRVGREVLIVVRRAPDMVDEDLLERDLVDLEMGDGRARGNGGCEEGVGIDAFRELDTWKDYRRLFELADMAVWSRPPHRPTAPRALLPVAARGDFCYGPNRTTLRHATGNRVHFLTVTALDISASQIRQRTQRGRSIRFLVPPAVERYLTRERLYSTSRASD